MPFITLTVKPQIHALAYKNLYDCPVAPLWSIFILLPLSLDSSHSCFLKDAWTCYTSFWEPLHFPFALALRSFPRPSWLLFSPHAVPIQMLSPQIPTYKKYHLWLAVLHFALYFFTAFITSWYGIHLCTCFTYFLYPSLECKLNEDSDIVSFCSLLYTHHLQSEWHITVTHKLIKPFSFNCSFYFLL